MPGNGEGKTTWIYWCFNSFSLKSKAVLENMDMGWNALGFNVDEEITVDNGLQNSLPLL